ncbi:MAG: hypothetical protein ABFE01_12985, partial [Phycisphaerales bacterium]
MNAERNRRMLWTISLFIAACCGDAWAQQNQEHKYSGGHGTEGYPYKIATAADLVLLGESPADYGKHFILTADIDLDPNLPGGRTFDRAVIAPDVNDSNLEFDGTPFSGTFDGDGHTISHLTITGTGYLGLFGRLKSLPRVPGRDAKRIDARIMDLAVADVNITGWYTCAGGLAVYNDGVITGCRSSGHIMSEWSSGGGLVGVNYGTLTDSCSSCTVSGDDVGGLVQHNLGTIANCRSDGTISGDWYVGGLVASNSGMIMSSHSTSTVSGDEFVGGLVGNNDGAITTSYSSGIVAWGDYETGGLVGTNTGIISVCWSSEKVAGHEWVGGLVGANGGSVTASYAIGTVDGSRFVGGLVGEGGGITMCYSLARVTGHEGVGGLAGGDWCFTPTSFWDVEVSGQPNDVEQTGLTTARMKDINTFLDAGWDFVGETRNGTCDYWQMSPGEYPQLCWFAGNRPAMPEGEGTEEKPYLIRDARDLGTVWCEPTAHYRLVEDIDLSEIRWSMAVIPSFGGSFEGNYIFGLHIEGYAYLGLFGQTDAKARISWLRLLETEIRGTYCVGSLAGDNGGAIANCKGYGLIRGAIAVGAVVGSNRGSIAKSGSSGLVTGRSRVGGLVGLSSGSIRSSYADCVVAGDQAVGGLVGEAAGMGQENRETELVVGCYSTSETVGGEAVGG